MTGPENALSTTSHQVVYTAGDDNVFHLWMMTADGDDRVQLTLGEGAEATPAWSPDGTHIVFAAADDPDSDFDLWVIGVDGTGMRQLTDTDDLSETGPSWSPDATRLVYSQNTLQDEGASIRILDVADPDGEGRSVANRGDWPAWSPDGRTILYTGDIGGVEQLFTVPATGGTATMLAPDGPSSAYEASWSPDGTEIAFVAPSGDVDSEDPPAWNEDIWVMRADGTGARKVVSTEGNDHWMPTWSPDGRQLMYTADGAENEGEIALVELSSGQVTVLTKNEVTDMMPSWRPAD
jgi:TolB protein